MNQQATPLQEPGTGGVRWRFLLPLGLFAALLVVLFVGLVHSPEKNIIPSPLVGKAAPQFSIPNLVSGGTPVSSAALRGHWSLVNVWGSWCATCRDEHSTLLMIKQQGTVPIIGIDWNDTPANATNWLQQLGDPYQQVGEDPNGRVAIDWGVYAAPESFLINPQGVIVYKEVGEITPDIWREQFLSRINAAGGAAPPPATGG
ncbi:MAG TPA: DsbE family thiol:disulfide interchange protein [Steroidobacteraceae bacterium]|nr:DsbE family thiol:disulfide interchange protein [Steroidobacteraceae bacterium]